MNDILEGFEEILDDLKEFPDKGKITALTKIVRCTFSLLNIRALSNATLFFFIKIARATTKPIIHHISGWTNAAHEP